MKSVYIIKNTMFSEAESQYMEHLNAEMAKPAYQGTMKRWTKKTRGAFGKSKHNKMRRKQRK